MEQLSNRSPGFYLHMLARPVLAPLPCSPPQAHFLARPQGACALPLSAALKGNGVSLSLQALINISQQTSKKQLEEASTHLRNPPATPLQTPCPDSWRISN
ncbi:hypothetical protein SKAU_G00065460 [Synaphobranchus kaupii]|uniref:Uncharacterized protein n=1 Tax=Synaphobranchus kaupii TaxID=118154 RepID=A0A9Q1G6M8_SYNKA|nr:hypothetical protein SKAU_G00065460 [Synaphobranchus kaupii]